MPVSGLRCMDLALGTVLLVGSFGTAWGQDAEVPPGNTILEIELITPRAGGNILAPQRWGQLFRKLGEGVRVRAPLAGDKPKVSEEVRGTFRFVKVVGVLDRSGKVTFPNRAYSLNESDQLGEWLNELKVYGAQGSPSGQPLWGLSREQFDAIFKALAADVGAFAPSGNLVEEIGQLPIPKELGVRLHSRAEQELVQPSAPAGNVQVSGLSAGTALAAVLSQYGLGFRPLRTPSGSIELVVEPLKEMDDPWPIGWDLGEEETPGHVAPSLFQIEPFLGLDAQSLESALLHIARESKLTVVIDYRRCRAANVDVTKVQVSAPYKRSAWGVVLGSILRRETLNYSLRNDERGKVFVYVHPFERSLVRPE